MTLRGKQYGEYRLSVLNFRWEFANKRWLPIKMMRRVATLRSKQYGEYLRFAINYSGESIKNYEYLTEFEAKFKKSLNTE
jgi:hypothetical protein